MNILPLILALLLMLSLLTVEKIESFKNLSMIQFEHLLIIEKDEREEFNNRQRKLFKDVIDRKTDQLSFRYIVNKESRKNEIAAKQYRLLILELMKITYKDAQFYKELEKNRPNFLEEMLQAIENAADQMQDKFIKEIEDISKIQLPDQELHQAWYYMLKGTISKDKLRKSKSDMTDHQKEKAYLSLFYFINYNGADNKSTTPPPQIRVQHCPLETLQAIFGSEEIALEVIKKRSDKTITKDAFQNEFLEKRRDGLEDNLLCFDIHHNDHQNEYD